jgi:hypothetical protein
LQALVAIASKEIDECKQWLSKWSLTGISHCFANCGFLVGIPYTLARDRIGNY